MLCGGGFGLLLTTPWWNRYWREREYLADRFAYECGQATGLIEFPELHQFFDVAVPFGFLWRSHPHNEERIDRLLSLIEAESETDAGVAGTLESREGMKMPFWKRTRETKAAPVERKQGSAYTKAVLYLEVLDEGHAGWVPPELIEEEKIWIRANSRRIVDLAQHEQISDGRGVVSIVWTDDRDEGYVNDAFHYMPRDDHAEYLDDPTSGVRRQFDPVMRAALLEYAEEWQNYVATYHLKDQVIVLVTSLDPQVRRYGTSHYLLEIRVDGARSEQDGAAMPQAQHRETKSMDRFTPQGKEGGTDGEGGLDLVFHKEAHASWSPPEQIAAEKSWIRANGQWLVELALEGNTRLGQGFIYLRWKEKDESDRRTKAHFRSLRDYVDDANKQHSFLSRYFDDLDCETWAEIIVMHDPDKHIMMYIEREGPNWTSGLGHYYIIKPGGALLLPWE